METINNTKLVERLTGGDHDSATAPARASASLTKEIELTAAKIRQLCYDHHAEFIDSINSLFHVRGDMRELKQQVYELNAQVQRSGAALLRRARALQRVRHRRLHMLTVEATLADCMRVLELADAARDEIHRAKYFAALRTIDAVRGECARLRSFAFAARIGARVPALFDLVATRVRSDFDAWLMATRRASKELGALAFLHTDVALQRESDEQHAVAAARLRNRRRHSNAGVRETKMLQRRRRARDGAARDDAWLNSGGGGDNGDGAGADITAATGGDDDGVGDNDDDEALLAQAHVDFAAVYQALYVHERLDRGRAFKRLYFDARRAELEQALDAHRDVGDAGDAGDGDVGDAQMLEANTEYFARIAGFFIVENALRRSASTSHGASAAMHGNDIDADRAFALASSSSSSTSASAAAMSSSDELLTRAQFDGLWEVAVAKMKQLLAHHMDTMTEPAAARQVKYTALLLCRSLDSHDFRVGPLLAYLHQLQPLFERTLCTRLAAERRDAFRAERYEPLTVSMVDVYVNQVQRYALDEPIDRGGAASPAHSTKSSSSSSSSSMTGVLPPPASSFPVTLSFSSLIPSLCRIFDNFITDFYDFTFALAPSHDDVAAATERELIAQVDDELQRMVNGDAAARMHISQAVQLAINAQYMLHVCSYIERALSARLDPRYVRDVILNAARLRFTLTRAGCEDLVIDLLTSKIDAFFQCAPTGGDSWSWTHRLSSSSPPSDYVTDMLTYLDATLANCLHHVPRALRESVHFAACQHISAGVLRLLAHVDVAAINLTGLVQLDVDTRAFDAFAAHARIANLGEAFAPLRQFVHLLSSAAAHLPDYCDANLRRNRYGSLSPRTVLRLLQKWRVCRTPPPVGMVSVRAADVKQAIERLKAEVKADER
jgi:hypothetical protein